MNDDPIEMRASILRRMRAGLLPLGPGDRTYGGYGDGRLCDACERPIGRSEVQYEVDCVGSTSTHGRTIVLHRLCHSLWLELTAEAVEPMTG
jgi:hypothetical protein